MFRKTLILIATVTSLLSHQLDAQDHGEFLGVDIVRPGSGDPSATLTFDDEVRDRRAKLQLGHQGLHFYNDINQVSIHIAHDAASVGLSVEHEGVGVGTAFPKEALHVYGNRIGNGAGYKEASVRVENSPKMAPELRTMFQLVNAGPARFELENTNSNQIWAVQTNHSDNFMINRLGSGGNEFSIRKSGMITMGPGGAQNFILHANGNLEIAGSISQMSDRNQKTAVQPVDRNDVLDRVNQLSITSWQYKDDQASVRHIGPMSQDFHAQFALGGSDTSISSVDSSGVALVAIQALSQQLEEKSDCIEQLREELEKVKAQLNLITND